jgi:hypothetical protein
LPGAGFVCVKDEEQYEAFLSRCNGDCPFLPGVFILFLCY